MKRNLIVMAVAVLITTSPAMADNYSYLTIKKNDTAGTEQSVALSTLKKITFESGSMILTTTSGSTSFTLTELSNMYFASTATGILGTTDDESNGILRVYATSGVKMAEYTSGTKISDIDLSNLPKGVYFIKSNGKTIKVSN